MTDESALESFLSLLSEDNRAWVESRYPALQEEFAARHFAILDGEKADNLREYNTKDEDPGGVALGDLESPAHLADAMIRQERERDR